MASDVLRAQMSPSHPPPSAGASEAPPEPARAELGTPGAGAHGVGGPHTVADVYDAHSDYVWRCLRSLGVHHSQLDDAVQDVFMVVHQKLASFDGACALRTWLYAIVVRVARKKRSASARAWVDELEARGQPVERAGTDCTEQSAAAREGLALAHRALEGMGADQREVFVLIEIEQMSAPEVAEVLGLPVNTVYSRLRLARAAFSQQVERQRRIAKPASTRGRP
jgi:RNA polymerase sigma-70 factor (ECF subfamily)